MRVLLQRVSEGSVAIAGVTRGSIGRGFVLLVGFTHGDAADAVEWMADKIAGIRLFADAEGKMNLDLQAVGGSVLVISQFTLYGDTSRGRRPSFVDAEAPGAAIPLYESFLAALRARGLHVEAGEFGADMQVSLVNDGPVTLMLERRTP